MLQPQKKPVETHYKNTYFLYSVDKNAYRRKLKDRFPLLYCNVVCGNTRNDT